MLAPVLRDAVPSATAIAQSDRRAWTGDVFGAIYIAIAIRLLPRLGTATLVALVVVGQMLASPAVGPYGLSGSLSIPCVRPAF